MAAKFTIRECFGRLQRHLAWIAARVTVIGIAFVPLPLAAQTSSTGSISGVVVNQTGAVVPGSVVDLTNIKTESKKSVNSDELGRFAFLLLTPGRYVLSAGMPGVASFKAEAIVDVSVTEVIDAELQLKITAPSQSIDVVASSGEIQNGNPALGQVINEPAVSSLPLATRNFAQLVGLTPGVATGVSNAGELGLGDTALSQIARSNDGLFVHGARSYDNNFQLDGISVSDVQGSAGGSGGIPIPNPDSIQEFKVQTAMYDAAYGRYAGANLTLITKTGGNDVHGTAFGYFRNELLNGNDFFLNRAFQPRPVLKQNQFGFTLSGPIKKDALTAFGSYQGTRQTNGSAAGQSRTACAASLSEPPLTNDRSPAALGRLFGGLTGTHGGTAIRSDGSNINPVAAQLLNLKHSEGSFLIPTPQTLDSAKPFAQQGFSVFSDPCHFEEDQFSANVDYFRGPKSRTSGQLFFADDAKNVSFPGNGVNSSGNIAGFPSPINSRYVVFSLSHSSVFRNDWVNEARFGYVRTSTGTKAETAFNWQDIGVAEGEMSHNSELPSLNILGSVSIASGFPRTITQNSFVFSDDVSFVRGSHTFRMGGSLTRLQDNVDLVGLGSFLQFLSWPDFLLGQSAAENGTRFSNVFASFDDFGLTNRELRVWEGSAYIQDGYRIRRSLTINLGLRYEHLGQFGGRLGRNSSFDIKDADTNPPPTGSVAGYVVASNFDGMVPTGVRRADNSFGNNGIGQNTVAPRLGVAWQVLPWTSRLLLRAGYGMYHSRPTGQAFYQNILGAPFSMFRLNTGEANAVATFAAPFPQPFPTPSSFPLFPSYSPTSKTTIYSIASDFRPALIQQYSLNVQAEPHETWILQAGYVGTRGLHLMRQRSLNQALPASFQAPIRGVSDNTLANIGLRVPIPGVPPDSLVLMESEGSSWYNGLEASLAKRFSHGFQLLASYTFSKTLDTDGSDVNSVSTGNALTLGDQNSPSQRWGRASFDRTHRFVVSGNWALPSPAASLPAAIFGNWWLSGILTIQSGSALTIAATNSTNVYGISEDRAQLTGACSKEQIINAGSVQSKLNSYFNTSCFTAPPVIGADGVGTAFGNSATGIVKGPGQANLDISVAKNFRIGWPQEKAILQFSAAFFNALNHPQFGNPDANFSSPTFGVISSTSVNARVGQLALRFEF